MLKINHKVTFTCRAIRPISMLTLRMFIDHVDYVGRHEQDFRVRLFVCLSVYLSVCPEHNSKTNDPKLFKLGTGNYLGIPQKWYRFGVQSQRSRLITAFFHTNVRNITQKRMIPKCSNLIGITLGYPAIGVVWVERSKVKVRVSVSV